MWNELRDSLTTLSDDVLHLAIILTEAGLILLIGARIGRAARSRVERNLARQSFGKNGAVLVGRLASLGILFLAVLLVLGLFGANWTALLALVSIGSVAIGLALQDVLKNFIAGVYLLLERPFRVGDTIKVRDVEGIIDGIDIRTTLIRNARGELVLIPNATVFTEILTNRTESGIRRLDVMIDDVSASPIELSNLLDDTFAHRRGALRPILSPVVTRVAPESISVEWSVQYLEEAETTHSLLATLQQVIPGATINVESA